MKFEDIITPSNAFARLLDIMDDNNLSEPFADVLEHQTAEDILNRYLPNLPNLEVVFADLQGVDDRYADYFIEENYVLGIVELASISFEHVFEMIREIQRRITEHDLKELSIEEHESAGVQKLATDLNILRDEIFAPFDLLNLTFKYTDENKQASQKLAFFLKQAEAIRSRIQSVDEAAELPSIQNLTDLYSFLETQGIYMEIYPIRIDTYDLINEYIKKCFEEESEKAPTSPMVIMESGEAPISEEDILERGYF